MGKGGRGSACKAWREKVCLTVGRKMAIGSQWLGEDRTDEAEISKGPKGQGGRNKRYNRPPMSL